MNVMNEEFTTVKDNDLIENNKLLLYLNKEILGGRMFYQFVDPIVNRNLQFLLVTNQRDLNELKKEIESLNKN